MEQATEEHAIQLAQLQVEYAEQERELRQAWQKAEEMAELAQANAAQLAGAQVHVQKLAVQLENAKGSAEEWRAAAGGLESYSGLLQAKVEGLAETVREVVESASKTIGEHSAETRKHLDEVEVRFRRSEDQRVAAVEQVEALEKRIERLEGELTVAEEARDAARAAYDDAVSDAVSALQALVIEDFGALTLSEQLRTAEKRLVVAFGGASRGLEAPAGAWLSSRVAELEQRLERHIEPEPLRTDVDHERPETLDDMPQRLSDRAELSQELCCQDCGRHRAEWEGFVVGADAAWRCKPCGDARAREPSPNFEATCSSSPVQPFSPIHTSSDLTEGLEEQCKRLDTEPAYADGFRAGMQAGFALGRPKSSEHLPAERSEVRPGTCSPEQLEALADRWGNSEGRSSRKSLRNSSRKHVQGLCAEGRTSDGKSEIASGDPVTEALSKTVCQNMANRLESQAPERGTSEWVDRTLDTVSRLFGLDRTQDLALRILVKRPGGR